RRRVPKEGLEPSRPLGHRILNLVVTTPNCKTGESYRSEFCAAPVRGRELPAAAASCIGVDGGLADVGALVEMIASDSELASLLAAWSTLPKDSLRIAAALPTLPKAIRRMMVALLDRG